MEKKCFVIQDAINFLKSASLSIPFNFVKYVLFSALKRNFAAPNLFCF